MIARNVVAGRCCDVSEGNGTSICLDLFWVLGWHWVTSWQAIWNWDLKSPYISAPAWWWWCHHHDCHHHVLNRIRLFWWKSCKHLPSQRENFLVLLCSSGRPKPCHVWIRGVGLQADSSVLDQLMEGEWEDGGRKNDEDGGGIHWGISTKHWHQVQELFFPGYGPSAMEWLSPLSGRHK